MQYKLKITRFIKIFISLIFLTIDKLGEMICDIFDIKYYGYPIILNYHDISDNMISIFKLQIDTIRKTLNFVKADLSDYKKIKKNQVGLTFDDGYQSVLKNAIPILYSYRIPCTIFIPTKYICKNPNWTMDLNCKHSYEVVMCENQIMHMDKTIVDFGSHSHSHKRLAEISEEDIYNELKTSKLILENILNKSISSLALPHGSFSNKVLKIAKEIGYKKIFFIAPQENNKYGYIGRFPVHNDELIIEFYLKINGSYRWLIVFDKLKQLIKSLLKK